MSEPQKFYHTRGPNFGEPIPSGYEQLQTHPNWAGVQYTGEPTDAFRMLNTLRNEYGDPIHIWGQTGREAWETIIGMFITHGWGPK